ncbi:hypothetical protein TNIN_475091 [Trichonephila inaurata madagascariensis]|uniref:Uncharacterized protein n=1 Tax=Trichonephila inaurata madagascariensis TaxID=2747483 RepID=A0A8X6XIU7_9ARAC|nr:hypothetical protein TNIN_475091 [Trichonephila inaurata madagascariensis]
MASTPDDSMTMDSRTPSRSSTPIPSTLCQRHQDLANEIKRLTLLMQGSQDTLNSLQKYGTFSPQDAHVLHLQDLMLT